MTPSDPHDSQADREALDRRWRRRATLLVVGFVLVTLLLAFLVVPGTREPGFEPLQTIGRSVGLGAAESPDARPAAAPATPGPRTDVQWNAATRALLAGADIAEGQRIASQTCVACHGTDGVGILPAYPNLTNQSAAAMYKQLRDYKSGARTGGMAAVMQPMALPLDDRQMANVAKYYASLEPRVSEFPKDLPQGIFELVKLGSRARALAPCDSCHGVNMSGPEESPVLLGQSPEYFVAQLQAFADGTRRNDIYGRMRIIARALAPEEMQQLAEYYAPPE